MESSDRDIDDFLNSLPEDRRTDMKTLHAEISDAMEGLSSTMYEGKFWGGTNQEIVGYGTYSYQRSDKKLVEWFVIGLANQKNYISVYVSAVEDGEYLSEKYGKDVGKVKVGKSSISFSSLDDIDLGKLLTIVKRARELTDPELLA